MEGVYRTGALVSAVWLRTQLQKPARDLRLLDTSWSFTVPGPDDYRKKHIPGAQFHDLNHCVTPTPFIPRNLPDPGCYGRYMRTLGVSTNSHVVFYDREFMKASARSWWLLRAYGHQNVSVLDGGLLEWEAQGHEVTTAEPEKPDEGDFTARVQENYIRDYDAICDNMASRAEQVLDSRLTENFRGGEEPSPPTSYALKGWNLPMPDRLLPGHVPGSGNLPFPELFQPDKHMFKNVQQLDQLFKKAGIDLTRPLVTTCYIGHTACLLALAAAVLGKTDTAVYYGSWTEYGQRSKPENVVTGV